MLTLIFATVLHLAPAHLPAPVGGYCTEGFQVDDQCLPPCTEEDGNTDGAPCVWTDPDTGRLYYVDSANYATVSI